MEAKTLSGTRRFAGLLAPYRVLDLTDQKGQFCGKMLGDLGADVVKIEPTGGDAARTIGPFYHNVRHPERSLHWYATNSSKRGITLDIETADGRNLLMAMVRKADFVIESFPPGYLRKLGLHYDALSETNPRLILTSITPFGQRGPYSRFRASDITEMAMGGLMYIYGDRDRPPVRISLPQAHYWGGVAGAAGCLAAFWHRQATGEGQVVDVSIQEAVLWATFYPVPYWDIARFLFARTGSKARRLKVAYGTVFACKDGFINYRALGGAMFGPGQSNLVRLMGREGLDVSDLAGINWAERGIDNTPQKDVDYFETRVAEFFKRHTRQELLDLSIEHNFMMSPINTNGDILNDAHLRARDYWVDVPHPELGRSIRYPGPYYKSTTGSSAMSRRAPLIGEHNDEIYRGELGLSDKDLETLKQSRVI